MTNKEFQDILAQYPDDYIIQMDNAFGWETPSSKTKVDPQLYINTDFGFIEIEPPEIRDLWVRPEERLPENGDVCMVCLKLPGNVMYNEMMVYNKEEKQFFFTPDAGDTVVSYPISEVVAWFLIPKFYEQL